jgi:osmotically-inducible protein OsmY
MVDWPYQRDHATRAVQDLVGVERVENRIHLRERVTRGDVRRRIESALQRNAAVAAHRIQVELEDNRATLTGRVQSLAEKETAERAAWNVSGVIGVDNRLVVDP